MAATTASLTSRSAPPVATLLRNEPFRLFFPLACAIGSFGVSHWILLSTGALERYLGTFHAVSQTQAFLLAFAAGFLLTAVPKRTRSAPASWLEIGALALLLPAVSLLTLFGATVAGQVAYAASLVVLVQFAVRRFLGRAAGRRPPASFVLVPLGFLSGLTGAVLMILATRVPEVWVHDLARSLLFEGVFLCLSLGVGGFFLSLATRGEAPPDLGSPGVARNAAGYALAGLVTLGSFALPFVGPARLGPAVRAVVAALVLVSSGAWRPPTKPGLNRKLLWLSAWAIPTGLALAAALPEQRLGAMHVVFVGGFGLLAFAVAAHVSMGHAGLAADQNGRPWPVAVFGALFLLAMVLRAVAGLMPDRYVAWLGAAATVWMVGTITWAAFLLPKMWSRPVAEETVTP